MTKVTTYPANERVIAIAANATPVEWPVSGDESVRAHGYIGMRRARDSVSLWDFPGIKPKIKTTGIRVGDTIVTWNYTGVVGILNLLSRYAPLMDNIPDWLAIAAILILWPTCAYIYFVRDNNNE